MRSGALHNIVSSFQKVLLERKARLVLDLRSEKEQEKSPDDYAFLKGHGIHFVSIPLWDILHLGEVNRLQGELSLDYLDMLERNKEGFRKIFSLFATFEKGILFHCHSGKDRTGVVAILLLSILDVPEEEIVSDYSLTEGNMVFFREGEKDFRPGLPEFTLHAKKETAEKFLKAINGRAGILSYLRRINVSEEEIRKIQKKTISVR